MAPAEFSNPMSLAMKWFPLIAVIIENNLEFVEYNDSFFLILLWRELILTDCCCFECLDATSIAETSGDLCLISTISDHHDMGHAP